MPPVLYECGSGKPYSTLQAAWDAMVADYTPTVTANVEIRAVAGEDFSGTPALNSLLAASVAVAAGKMVTVRSASFSNRAHVTKTLATPFQVNIARVKVQGFKATVTGLYAGVCNQEDDYFDAMEVVLMTDSTGIALDSDDATNRYASNCFFRAVGATVSDRAGVECKNNSKVYGCTFKGLERGIFRAAFRSGIESKNNIYHSCITDIYMGAGGGAGDVVSDYNVHYNATHVGHGEDGVDYDSLATWAAHNGGEGNSIATNPLLTSGTDPHLQAGSPAIDAGVTLAAFPTDYDGETRAAPYDIGADEFSVSASGAVQLLFSRRRRGR